MDFTALFVLAAEGTGQGDTPSGLGGIGIIIATLVVMVVVIAVVWTFAAKRGSRTPRRDPHRRHHAGRT